MTPKPRMTWVGLAMGALYWMSESILHAWVFTPEYTLVQTLAGEHDVNEIVMRCVIVGLMVLLGFGADIFLARQEKTRIHVERINSLLRFLSQMNQVIQRTKGEKEIFEKACGAAVEMGGFLFAWIGLGDKGGDSLRVAALAAKNGALVREIRQAGDAYVACPLAREALDQDRSASCDVLKAADCPASWRDSLLKGGCASGACFPLYRDQQQIGVFSAYLHDEGFFKEEETRILAEAADDISYTLTRLEARAQRGRDKAALMARVEELERFRKVTVGREFRIKELRDVVKTLKEELDRLRP